MRVIHFQIKLLYMIWLRNTSMIGLPFRSMPSHHLSTCRQHGTQRSTLLYPSLRHDANPQTNAELRASFTVPPTPEKFIQAISRLPTNSEAGPTGLTYNMRKRWSPKVVEVAHRALNVQFKDMHIPKWWRLKWLAPLPKTQDHIPALTDN